MVAADGEARVVGNLADLAQHFVDSLIDGETPTVPPTWRGNGLAFRVDSAQLHLATEWTGTFPLYYARSGEGLAFSSHLRPLARALNAESDYLGAMEFLRYGYCLSGRTPFQGISRLLPGQSLTYDRARDRARVLEHSTLWAEPMTVRHSELDEVLNQLWARLRDVLADSCGSSDRVGLMMSGGWDSRTLLAVLAILDGPPDLLCYSHGDTESREHRIVEDLARARGAERALVPIEDDVWNPETLRARFEITENVCFPEWHSAGQRMQKLGVDRATAGVFGEVVGGHYGEPSVRGGAGKMLSLTRRLLGHYRAHYLDDEYMHRHRGDRNAALELLRCDSVESHWYLTRDFEESLRDLESGINADIRQAVRRLRERGVRGLDTTIEAFKAEFRGAQRINAQLLSCRPDVEVVIPFIDQRLLQIATQLPFECKINNQLNRGLLQRYARDLLDFPMAATLVKSSRPIWLQELSRGVRRARENFEWKRYLKKPGKRESPEWGWVNFEFLRDGSALRRIRADLKADFWDMDAFRAVEENLQSSGYRYQLHPLYDQVSKVYSLDLMYR